MKSIKAQVPAKTGVRMAKYNKNEVKLYDYWAVLSAYETGRKAGIELSDKVYKKTFEDNLKKLGEASRKIFTFLQDRDIECHEVLVRPENITEFDLLFAITRKTFNSVEFAQIYGLVKNQIKNIQSKTLSLSISFMPYSEDINEEKLATEGFLTIYNGKKS